MTTFDQRERAFESQFAHDEEVQFRLKARRNRAVAAWASSLMRKEGAVATAYGDDVVASAVAGADDAAPIPSRAWFQRLVSTPGPGAGRVRPVRTLIHRARAARAIRPWAGRPGPQG